MRDADWRAEYEAERREAAGEVAPRPSVVYLVLECDWEYNDSFFEASNDGVLHKAFRSFERAVAYAQELRARGVLGVYQIVEHVLEEGEG